ncbi:glycosyltransferase, group 1 family protein [Streptomyces azureus]|uniref:Glycosyltransferase, group 1 family protein n=1 Tax=Streptomyces azureus TaxID=146537 RepID=A0A0K8PI85_STRAJ|nr:glycosyltransferase, group 1 family protein [Streptomyces azureus]
MAITWSVLIVPGAAWAGVASAATPSAPSDPATAADPADLNSVLRSMERLMDPPRLERKVLTYGQRRGQTLVRKRVLSS